MAESGASRVRICPSIYGPSGTIRKPPSGMGPMGAVVVESSEVISIGVVVVGDPADEVVSIWSLSRKDSASPEPQPATNKVRAAVKAAALVDAVRLTATW